MFSENLKTLFRMLSCTNSEIARAAGCSRSYISHVLNDNRDLKPSSRAVVRLTEGIYHFADEENMLGVLCMLTKTEKEDRSVLLPALTAWLFDINPAPLPSPAKLPKRRKNTAVIERQEFGDRLGEVMNLLELSNARLARTINVDDSLVSRWRSGLRSPRGNEALSELLAKALIRRSGSMDCMAKLAGMADLSEKMLEQEEGIKLWEAWLLGRQAVSIVPVMDRLLESISSVAMLPDVSVDGAGFSLPAAGQERYWGVEGLRQAVLRFLADAAGQGGELWLYSDESMAWMVGDDAFYAEWKARMAACIRAGVKIKIIHNIDRGIDEMLTAIGSWMSLYMSGQIEPYVCRRPKEARFSHTFFLRPGQACIYGTGVSGVQEKWYDYIVDARQLAVLLTEYEALLSFCEPLVKVYIGEEQSAVFRRRFLSGEKQVRCVLPGLSLMTLPGQALDGMLARSGLEPGKKAEIREIVQKRQEDWSRPLAEPFCEMVVLPEDDVLFKGGVSLNLNMELMDVDLYYTEEEYAMHVQAVLELLRREKNYQMFVLPALPFPDIQIALTREQVTVIRSRSPGAAFSFTDPYMVHAFLEYFDSLKQHCQVERNAVCQMLRRYL